jgi:hypothetical protein
MDIAFPDLFRKNGVIRFIGKWAKHLFSHAATMCFMLHIATHCELSRRAWNKDDRHVWLGDIGEHADAVRAHFFLPNIAYVGSDLNCGCGFRSLSFQNGEWPEEYLVAEGKKDTEGTEKNHRELHGILTDVLRHSAMVELYGCWAGDYREKTERELEIGVDDILSDRFFFKERVLYRVKGSPSNGMKVACC